MHKEMSSRYWVFFLVTAFLVILYGVSLYVFKIQPYDHFLRLITNVTQLDFIGQPGTTQTYVTDPVEMRHSNVTFRGHELKFSTKHTTPNLQLNVSFGPQRFQPNGTLRTENVHTSHSDFSSPFIIQQPLSERVPVSKSGLTTKVIFSYNRPGWLGTNFDGCEVDACRFTDDRKELDRADAVLVHVCRVEDGMLPPASRPRDQVWVAFGLESPVHYSSGYRRLEWQGAFNLTMTYRVDSDIFVPYAFLVYRPNPPYKNYTAIAAGKTKMAAWFVSNCHTPSRRRQYVNELQKYIGVDVYGDCGTFHCPRDSEEKCMELLNSTYRFYLSFENSLCRDYVTEKFFKVFVNVDIIPVVRGGADYKKYFPPGTFVDAADFRSPKDLAAHLMQLTANQEAYTAMLRRKDHYISDSAHWQRPCHLCKKLHENKTVKTYPDLPQWISAGMCRTPTDFR